MRYLLAVAGLLGAPLLTRADFSAVQNARMSVGEGQMPAQVLKVYQKGKKTRYDVNANLTVILDMEAKQRTTLDRAKKTYSVAPWEPAPENPFPGKVTITPTERRTTVAGHPARLYLWKTDLDDIGITGEIWCAEDLPRVMLPSLVGGGFDPASQNKGMDGHPVRVRLTTILTEKGKKVVRSVLTTEVSALSTRELPESYFEVPSGYSEEKK
jgi:hypothetical protein